MKRKLLIAAALAAAVSIPAWAHGGGGYGPGYGYGMGPGMMGGYGPGGWGMGPGMMWGYGGGGPGGWGMGPGMMWGYGGGPGGWGVGPGMMWGYGGGPGGSGMGPGMMWGYGPGGYGAGGYAGLKLSDEQRSKIAAIQEEFSRKQWDLMNKMHQQGYQLYGRGPSGRIDENAARKAYEAMADARNAMFENSLEMRKRIDAVLTKEQREQLRREWGGG